MCLFLPPDPIMLTDGFQLRTTLKPVLPQRHSSSYILDKSARIGVSTDRVVVEGKEISKDPDKLERAVFRC